MVSVEDLSQYYEDCDIKPCDWRCFGKCYNRFNTIERRTMRFMESKFIEWPTHVTIRGKRYPLTDDPTVAEHSEKCMRREGRLSPSDLILPTGKRLAEVVKADLEEAEEVEQTRGTICLTIGDILEAIQRGDREAARVKLFEMHRRFELRPNLRDIASKRFGPAR